MMEEIKGIRKDLSDQLLIKKIAISERTVNPIKI